MGEVFKETSFNASNSNGRGVKTSGGSGSLNRAFRRIRQCGGAEWVGEVVKLAGLA